MLRGMQSAVSGHGVSRDLGCGQAVLRCGLGCFPGREEGFAHIWCAIREATQAAPPPPPGSRLAVHAIGIYSEQLFLGSPKAFVLMDVGFMLYVLRMSGIGIYPVGWFPTLVATIACSSRSLSR